MVRINNIILKLSGEILSEKDSVFGETGFRFIKDEIVSAREENPGLKIGIVIGGGNIYRGRQKFFTRVTGDSIGMLATIINAFALKDYFQTNGLDAELFTPLPLPKVGRLFTLDDAESSLKQGKINIYGGGTGNPFFSTDSLAVLRALETKADAVFKGTKVDGVYDSDPVTNKTAKRFSKIEHLEVVRQNLNVMDLPAISLALETNLKIFVFDFFKKGNLREAVKGNLDIGTLVSS